jgi:hypothetical protein
MQPLPNPVGARREVEKVCLFKKPDGFGRTDSAAFCR